MISLGISIWGEDGNDHACARILRAARQKGFQMMATTDVLLNFVLVEGRDLLDWSSNMSMQQCNRRFVRSELSSR
jgi:hypothetical protein